ncbi:EVE domain-containing protein [Aspergillus candidus]|uniref:Thymocyte nuclear protein 1 n=1 Tax=Aspergillus candidus TaxID=41067 RepID=A0A2I2FDI1_ASPCN|nr:DUF55-domain-containing protein [Aspergillus candidus]PLB38669.1 DUF55-domain-containing protein [Aspergillus candidus]
MSSSPVQTATPVSGEKRKRGRPRKYPEGQGPQPTPGPKRGRGRPRKDPNAPDTPSKPNTPRDGKRPVGRPRKSVNGADVARLSKSESADAKADEPSCSYWLLKAEPESRMEKGVDVKFSIDDLQARTKPEPWDGTARNHIREMKKGDLAFFYHSNCRTPGIVGVMEIVQEHSPDESAFDPKHPYYDEKSNRDEPKWSVVHVEFRRKFDNLISLTDLKGHSAPGGPLENLQVLKQSRLSVSPVSAKEWNFIHKLVEEASGSTDGAGSAEESSE